MAYHCRILHCKYVCIVDILWKLLWSDALHFVVVTTFATGKRRGHNYTQRNCCCYYQRQFFSFIYFLSDNVWIERVPKTSSREGCCFLHTRNKKQLISYGFAYVILKVTSHRQHRKAVTVKYDYTATVKRNTWTKLCEDPSIRRTRLCNLFCKSMKKTNCKAYVCDNWIYYQ